MANRAWAAARPVIAAARPMPSGQEPGPAGHISTSQKRLRLPLGRPTREFALSRRPRTSRPRNARRSDVLPAHVSARFSNVLALTTFPSFVTSGRRCPGDRPALLAVSRARGVLGHETEQASALSVSRGSRNTAITGDIISCYGGPRTAAATSRRAALETSFAEISLPSPPRYLPRRTAPWGDETGG